MTDKDIFLIQLAKYGSLIALCAAINFECTPLLQNCCAVFCALAWGCAGYAEGMNSRFPK